MSKVLGNYSSLVRGVSQQAPADRLEGQHGEQVNMLSDPVRGIVRRNGLVVEAQSIAPASGDPGNAIADSQSFRVFSYRSDGRELDLLYRSRMRVGLGTNHLEGLGVYDKTPDTSSGFKPVVTDPTDVDMQTYLEGGFSAVTSVGSFVLMAGNSVSPSYTSADQMAGQAWSNSGVAWVRGGAYARTYKLVVRRASTGVDYTVEYTTKAAAYPGTLDTSGISYSDPDYQKQINDMTYAYNAAVNQWIASASEDIVPANIAQKLVDALTAAGWTGWYINGSHIGHTDVAFMEVSDGGDGSLFVSLLNNTQAADEVTEMHHIGKVVKVQPKNSAEVYYLKAHPKDGNPDATSLRPVIWRETAGVVQTPSGIFAIGILHEGSFYVASTASKLAALILAATGDTVAVPSLVASTVGDTDTAAPPHFYGRTIRAMTVFQDRLMLVSDNVANFSRPGDYFNFYRGSVLTVADDDPVEVYALGTEGDTIRQSAVYDKNLILYGDKHHYAMSGKVPLTPTSAAMPVQYTIDNTAGARPVGAGQNVFCLKEDVQLAACQVLQLQAGLFQDTPQIVDASRQLRDYINGTPAEMVSFTSPGILFVRTEPFLKSVGAFPPSRPSGLYVYQYLDDDQGRRLVDSWHAWEWSMTLGTCVGISAASGSELMVYTLAWGKDETGAQVRCVYAMSVSTRPDPTGLPYLDGLRPAQDAEADGLMTAEAPTEAQALIYTAAGAAYSNTTPALSDAQRFAAPTHPHYTMGDAPPETVDPYRWSGVQGRYSDYIAAYPDAPTGDLWTGAAYPAYVDITNPFVRDYKGKAKTWGRLTLSRLRATLIRSAGFEAWVIDHVGAKRAAHFDSAYERIQYGVNVWVGRDAREVQVRLGAISWLPLTINALEWHGQWFEPLTKR